jgi:type 1 glutamine amidotransferase
MPRVEPIAVLTSGPAAGLASKSLVARRRFPSAVVCLWTVGLLALLGVRVEGGRAPEPKNTAPPPRTRAEVEAVLGKAPLRSGDAAKNRPLEVLLVAGKKDHGPGEHDYPAWQKQWYELLARSPGVKVATAFDKVEPKQWDTADVAVVYIWGPNFWPQEEHLRGVDRLLARGGGLVVLHSAVIPNKSQDPQQVAGRIGIAFPQTIKYRHGPLALKPTADLDHPVIAKLGTVELVDESYWPGVEAADVKRVQVLATTPEEGKERPMAWTYVPQASKEVQGGGANAKREGRVFCTILGHYAWTFDDPLARVLMLRGMAWAAGEQVDRFAALATQGVKLKEADKVTR